jgi:ABC-type uncharacterized transport system involved in gliding motility auxiliary subunit
MVAKKRSEKYVKFAVYLVVVVLVNLAASTLFFRLDLTKNDVYSLSSVSREVVANLQEPLTVKVFFSKDLNAPYNGIERYLRDLLEEYAVAAGNRYFNYQFHDVSPATDGSASENQQMAGSYGIQPLQIQELEQDEVKYKLAYMGLVVIYGDVVEKIPAITATDGLEYTLTTTFQKASNKISALLALEQTIDVKLFLSSSLDAVSPLIGMEDLSRLPETVRDAVDNLNLKNYNRLSFSYTDPKTEEDQNTAIDTYNVLPLKWAEIEEQNIPAGSGVVGLVMSVGDKTVSLPVVQVYRMPIFGTQYELASLEDIEEMIDAQVESLVNVNEKIGYLADHGTLSLANANAAMMGLDGGGDLSVFGELLGDAYSIDQFSLEEDPVSPDLRTIVIARPTEPFTDWDLFQIDQALMRGQNLAIFLDPFKENVSQGMAMGMQSQVSYDPLDTGLEKLLAHWGVSVMQSIVMDETCYAQAYSQGMGTGQQSIYYAPIIQPENINTSLPMMRNIKEFLALKASPITLAEETLSNNGLTATVVFSSSEKSWEMEAPINLNPLYHSPPENEDDFGRKSLACLIEGSFPSYFAGKQLPEKTVGDDNAGESDENQDPISAEKTGLSPQVTSSGGIIEQGKPAKVFLIGSGEMLRDNLLDEDGASPNSMFVMNMIDTLNGHEDMALMRSKTQSHNPLDATGAMTKLVAKTVNIAGLPFLVVLFGLFVWMRRHVRRKAIEKLFQTNQGARR